MKSYQTARRICSFLEFLGWSTVAGGIIIAFAMGQSVNPYAPPAAALTAAVPGIVIAIVALFCVGGVQGWRSSVDTAEYTQQMLKIARDQLEVSRQSLRGSKSEALSFGDVGDTGALSSGPSFSSLAGTEAASSAEQTRSTPQVTQPNAPPERRAIKQELDFQGRKLIEYADGSYALDGRNFPDLDGVKEHVRIESIRSGKHGF